MRSIKHVRDIILSRSLRSGDCFVWNGAVNAGGYGLLWLAPEISRFVHRLVWTAEYGPIPAGLVVCHACDNPPCVEIAHLWLGTPADNSYDRHAKGRTRVPRGESHGSTRISLTQAIQIRGSTEFVALRSRTPFWLADSASAARVCATCAKVSLGAGSSVQPRRGHAGHIAGLSNVDNDLPLCFARTGPRSRAGRILVPVRPAPRSCSPRTAVDAGLSRYRDPG